LDCFEPLALPVYLSLWFYVSFAGLFATRTELLPLWIGHGPDGNIFAVDACAFLANIGANP
jgi:hypothetical protein